MEYVGVTSCREGLYPDVWDLIGCSEAAASCRRMHSSSRPLALHPHFQISSLILSLTFTLCLILIYSLCEFSFKPLCFQHQWHAHIHPELSSSLGQYKQFWSKLCFRYTHWLPVNTLFFLRYNLKIFFLYIKAVSGTPITYSKLSRNIIVVYAWAIYH